jgi:hypothetical protein
VIRGSKAADRSKYRWGIPDWYSRLRQFLRLIWVDGHQLIQLRLENLEANETLTIVADNLSTTG